MRLSWFLVFAVVFSPVFAQTPGAEAAFDESRGDPAAAELYLAWAEQRIAEDHWAEALAALERAGDFADVLSDLSFLLARVRAHEGKPRGAVLEALGRSLEAKRWNRYSAAQARLLEAEQLVVMRNYWGALGALMDVPENAEKAALRLAALKGLAESGASGVMASAPAEFRRELLAAMDRYPRDPRPLRLFFAYARNRNPAGNDQALLELVLRRLPFALDADPDLAWMSAPFIKDSAEAARLVAAYRTGSTSLPQNGEWRPNPFSIPQALSLGLVSDDDAVEELFAFAADGEPVLSKEIIIELNALIVPDEARERLVVKLREFSGIITADENNDGYPESRAVYRNGVLTGFTYDADQDGLAELEVSFNPDGSPRQAAQVVLGDIEAGGNVSVPVKDEDRLKALIEWERYPSVLRTGLADTVYIPRPVSFQFAPLRFIELGSSEKYAGLSFPQQDAQYPRIGRRSLVSFALYIRKPSAEFSGAIEQFELDRGIPLRAVTTLNGRVVAETAFERGLPVLQLLDLDLDSRMETVRRFRNPAPGWDDFLDYKSLIASSESDWNGDGVYETGEVYLQDGSVVYSWDMDNDGVREYSETKPGN
jgi:hypothetical protein